MYIPDPTEILDRQIENNIDQYEEGQCMSCDKKVDYELIQATPHPSSPVVCCECLSPDAQEAYRKFEESIKGGN